MTRPDPPVNTKPMFECAAVYCSNNQAIIAPDLYPQIIAKQSNRLEKQRHDS
ncbi:MAG: hypothetical protein N838_34080 [Thiohalocapsa sp. PB-PSB1]|nr:MAG: hypothetical protein N838_34080 [Thiohalocapsa sp. PB-PSB1]